MKFRKKQIEVEAIQFLGRSNVIAVMDFMGKLVAQTGSMIEYITIPTAEGDMMADIGDWIIKEPFPTNDRLFYPCKPDIFEKTYEAV